MNHDAPTDLSVILFGAFDRHNFGDLLFPHIAARLLEGKKLLFAGLAERDLREHGGHHVLALPQLAAAYHNQPINILHVGGELLACGAWEAAAMLLPPDQAKTIIARLDQHPQQALEWAHAQLGISALAPYTVSRQMFPCAVHVLYNAVGGVDLDQRDAGMHAEVLTNLATADAVSVRDKQTQAILAAAGITARLAPDSAVMVAELFGSEIRQQTTKGELAQILHAFPRGYLAVQFSADFGDDETFEIIAAQLDRFAQASGLGIVFFRAGVAPWHDDASCYQRVAARMQSASVRIFSSLNLWDICALIASSKAYAGSSLHGRILAMAFALPRINLRHPMQAQHVSKQDAFAAAWEVPGLPHSVAVDEIAAGIDAALGANLEQLRQTASELATRYRIEFDALRDRL